MTGTLRVSPSKLIATSSEFSSQGNQISSLTREMLEKAKSLSSVWEGEAANAYITKFGNLEGDIQIMNRMIQEHVKDLQEMSRQYSYAESENTDESSGLGSINLA